MALADALTNAQIALAAAQSAFDFADRGLAPNLAQRTADLAAAQAALLVENENLQALLNPARSTRSVTMPIDARIFDPNTPAGYWAAAVGRRTNLQGMWVILPPYDYLWPRVGVIGQDPGLTEPLLAGLTGHLVEVLDGASADDIATGMGGAAATIIGWEGSTSSTNLAQFDGPAGDAFDPILGPEWDDRGNGPIVGDGGNADHNGLAGMWSHIFDAALGATNATVNGTVGQFFVSPPDPARIAAIQVRVGTFNGADQPRVSICSGSSSTDPRVNSQLLIDFGIISSGGNDRWVDLNYPLGESLVLAPSTGHWVTVTGLNATQLSRYDVSSSGLAGTFTNQGQIISTGGMPTNPSDPPTAWTGTIAAGPNNVLMIRILYEVAPFAARGEHYSDADRAVFGAHISDTAGDATLTASAVLTQSIPLPVSLGIVRYAATEMCIASPRPGQPRGYAYTGVDFTDPQLPIIVGATLVGDGGQFTGSATNVWQSVGINQNVAAGAILAIGITHFNGTFIRFVSRAAQNTIGNRVFAPMDFVEMPPTPTNIGPELAVISNQGGFTTGNPAVAPPATIAAFSPAVGQRPGNVGGTRARYFKQGMIPLF